MRIENASTTTQNSRDRMSARSCLVSPYQKRRMDAATGPLLRPELRVLSSLIPLRIA